MMEDIVYGNGHLVAYLQEEFDVRLTVGLFLQAPKSHGPQPSQRRGQGNLAEGVDAVLPHALSDLRPATFFGKIRNEQGLLRLPDQSSGNLFNPLFMATYNVSRNIRLERMQPHHVALGIV